MANRYNDQDYPGYYERDDRYDSRAERYRSGSRNQSKRGRSGSDRDRDDQTGYYGMSYNRDTTTGNQQSGYPGGYFGSDFGRGYSSEDHSYDDFTSSTRPARNYTGGFNRNTENDRSDYTLYGYDRESRYSATDRDRGRDSGNWGYGRGNRESSYGRRGGGSDRAPSFDRVGSSYEYDRYGDDDRYDDNDRDREHQRRGFGNEGDFHGRGRGFVGTERGYVTDRERNESNRGNYDRDERGWFEKAADEVSSWFGDEDAASRRERDSRRSSGQTNYRGRGPKNYRRSDDRIREDINDRLTDYPYLDASDIDVEVNGGEVVLTGTVESRYAKRMAEDIAENVSGVSNIENRLRVNNQRGTTGNTSNTSFSATGDTSTMTGGSQSGGATGASTGASLNSPAAGTTGNTNAMSAGATGGTTTGTTSGTISSGSTATTADSTDTTTSMSERGVDRLSKPSK